MRHEIKQTQCIYVKSNFGSFWDKKGYKIRKAIGCRVMGDFAFLELLKKY